VKANHYDRFAESYSTDSESNLIKRLCQAQPRRWPSQSRNVRA
jgi:hypothetical protein